MDLFLREATERIGVNYALSKIDALMDWASFSPILERGLGRSGVGPQGYDPQVVLSRLRSGLSTHLCGLSLKCQGAFAAEG